MVEELDDVLEDLVKLDADRVTLEWTSEGLEVTMYRGSRGAGAILTGHLARAIMEEVVTRARLEGRRKGMLKARVGEREMQFIAKEYDHFGETAFEIRARPADAAEKLGRTSKHAGGARSPLIS